MRIRLIGLDPGLRRSGWGVIEVEGSSLIHVASGAVTSDAKASLADRLSQLFNALTDVISTYQPAEAAVEETFVNKNPASTLKLGQARGVVMLAPAQLGIPVAEYAANLIKKSLVGQRSCRQEPDAGDDQYPVARRKTRNPGRRRCACRRHLSCPSPTRQRSC